MDRPKMGIVPFGLMILLGILFTVFLTTNVAMGQCTVSDTGSLIQLSSLTFSGDPRWYFNAAGSNMSQAELEIAPPAGSTTVAAFLRKINLESGVTMSFTYQTPATGTQHGGFAVMFQNIQEDARDGTGVHLGYRIVGALAIEFDFFSNPAASGDCSGGPHIAVSAGTATTAASSACPAGYKNFALASNDIASVEITIARASATTTGGMRTITVKHTLNSKLTTVSVVRDIRSAFDAYGRSWVSFTASSEEGNVAAPPISIKNFKIFTAGVDKISTLTVTQSPALSGLNLPRWQSVATERFSNDLAFNGRFTLQDNCGVAVRGPSEETQNIMFEFVPTAGTLDSLVCSWDNFLPTEEASYLWHSARISCQKTQAGENDRIELRSRYFSRPFETYRLLAGMGNVAAGGIKIVSSSATSQNSKIIKIKDLCDDTACNGSAGSSSGTALKPFDSMAGKELEITVSLQDAFLNPATSQTVQISVSIHPTPTEVFTLTPKLSGSTAIVTFKYTPQIQVEASPLVVSVASQAIATSQPYFRITPSDPHNRYTTITSGLTEPRYSAGTTFQLKLTLRDIFGNAITAPTTAQQGTLKLTVQHDAKDCGATNMVGFIDGCPSAVVFGARGEASVDWTPTTIAGQYHIICLVNGQPCADLPAPLRASAGPEDIKRTELYLDNDFRQTRLAHFRKFDQANPTTVPTEAISTTHFDEFISTVDGAQVKTGKFLAENYLVAGMATPFKLRSFDKYHNDRFTSATQNGAYTIRFYYTEPKAGSLTGSYDEIQCPFGGQPAKATLTNGFLLAANCAHSDALSYTVTITPQKSAYYLDAVKKTSLFQVVVFQGSSSSYNYYSFLSQASTTSMAPGAATADLTDSSATYVDFSSSIGPYGSISPNGPQRPVGQWVAYKMVPRDQWQNPVKPLGARGGNGLTKNPTQVATLHKTPRAPGSSTVGPEHNFPLSDADTDIQQLSFSFSHTVTGASSDSQPISAYSPLGSSTRQKVFYTEIDGEEMWVTHFLLRSASATRIRIQFRSQWESQLNPIPSTVDPKLTRSTTMVIPGKSGETVWKISWTVFDEFRNPTPTDAPIEAIFTTTQPVVRDAGPTLTLADQSANQVSYTIGYSTDFTTILTWKEVEIDSQGNPVEHTLIFAKAEPLQTDVVWKTRAICPTTVEEAKTGKDVPKGTTAVTITAGECLIAKLTATTGNHLSDGLARIMFDPSTYVPATVTTLNEQSGSTITAIYVVSRLELAVSAVKANGWHMTNSNGDVLDVTVRAGSIDLRVSTIDARDEMNVCDLGHSPPATGANTIIISPKDSFGNDALLTKPTEDNYPGIVVGGTLVTDKDEITIQENQGKYEIVWCQTTAGPVSFDVVVYNPLDKNEVTQNQNFFTRFLAGDVSQYVLEDIPENYRNCVDSAVPCAQCVLGQACTVAVYARDQFSNTIAPTLASTPLATFNPGPADAGSCAEKVKTIRNDNAAVFSAGTAPPEVSSTVTVSIIGDAFVLAIPDATFKIPSLYPVPMQSTCRDEKTLTITSGSVSSELDLYVSSAPATMYQLKAGANQEVSKDSATSIKLAQPLSLATGGTPLLFHFYDQFYNNWVPDAQGGVDGLFKGQFTGQAPVSFGSSSFSDDTTGELEAKVPFMSRGDYKLAPGSWQVGESSNLGGLELTIKPGDIASWDFEFTSYNQRRSAGTTWDMTAIAKDAFGNIIDEAETKAAIEAFEFHVFEGGASCSVNQNVADVKPLENQSSRFIHPDLHKFTIDPTKITFDSTTKKHQFTISTELANTLLPTGQRPTFTYFIAHPTSASSTTPKAYSCPGGVITILPAAPDETKSELVLGDPAIRNGDLLEFTIILRDRFNNTIPYPHSDDPSSPLSFQVENCSLTKICQDDECNPVSHQYANTTLSINAQGNTSFNFLAKVTSKGNVIFDFTCKTVHIYHSFPATIHFLPASPSFDATKPAENELPRCDSQQACQAGEIPQTIDLWAGVPQLFTITSVDSADPTNPNAKVTNYNDPAFGNTAGAELNYLKYEVNRILYRVTAQYVGPIAGQAQNDLSYQVVSDSWIKPITGTDPLYFQNASLLLQWPGVYEVSARVYSLAPEGTTGSPQVYINPATNLPVASTIPIRLIARSPICQSTEKYTPPDPSTPHIPQPYELEAQTDFGKCEPPDPATDSFSCLGANGPTSVLISNYDSVNANCQCDSNYYVLCKNRCIPKTSTCDDFTATPSRVCPPHLYLCGDRLTCVEDPATCLDFGPPQQCQGQHLCSDGSCASEESRCPTHPQCPSGKFLCPSGDCVSNSQYCPQLRQCNPFADPKDPSQTVKSIRCPNVETCVSDISQCPSTSVCPLGYLRCSTNGSCVPEIGGKCPAVEKCTGGRPFRCADNTCAVDSTFCATGASCGTSRPFLCPDRKTCVASISDCNLVQDCPEGTSLCSSGDCLPEIQCPTSPICHPSQPVLCINSQCESSKSDCNSADVAYAICPSNAPVRCGSGACVKDASLCPTLIQCPFFRPILCPTGECVSATNLCPMISNPQLSECPAGFLKCPVTGVCARFAHWCPTIRACRKNEIRCANGQCYPVKDSTSSGSGDPCPAHAQNVPRCAEGTIQCPTTNVGTMCRAKLSDCPTDVVCPSTTPFRCESNQCVASIDDCAWADANNIPETRVPCGMNTWSSAFSLCGSPPTCPPQNSVLCLDGSCRQTPADCPEATECPSNVPFKCASGECQLNSYSCSLSRCSDPKKPVRCPSHDAASRCVAEISQCPNVYDARLTTTLDTPCVFGVRCWNGVCVSEARLCSPRTCPAFSPFLCEDGGCKKSQAHCNTSQGCPYDRPIWCNFTAKCVATQSQCQSSVAPPCAPDSAGNPLTRCQDGTCRLSDECLFTGPFGCPPEQPLRCLDGSCVSAVTTSNPVSVCKAQNDLYNACPSSRPIRCPGGMCSTSLSRCPTFASLPEVTQNLGVCRQVKRRVVNPDNKDKTIEITENLTVTCDDGSCAFSHSECPVIKPCKKTEFRCGDGTCRPALCDLSTKRCRQDLQDRDYLGAQCPDVNTCPELLPYRCQSGECATDRSQCISNFPIILNSCCGPRATYNPGGNKNPQGEDLGTCVDLPLSAPDCIDTPLAIDNITNLGCPRGTTRCTRGQCVDQADAGLLCGVYEAVFAQLGEQSQTCVVRCNNGRCVDDYQQCTNDNGCPILTPVLCADGSCAKSKCSSSSQCSKSICPNGRCVDDLSQCVTPMGCPLTEPVLCADGTCKKRASTQSGLTSLPWPTFTPPGIPEDVCRPALTCSGFTPFLCGDGSCQASLDHCPPVMAKCPGLCRVACPLSNHCVQLEVLVLNGLVHCDFEGIPERCAQDAAQRGEPTEQCPNIRPILCQSGQCVADSSLCGSPFVNAGRVSSCPTTKPWRCVNGNCATRPFECVKQTAAILGHTVEPNSVISEDICEGGYLCPDGLCAGSVTQCATLPACPVGAKLCEDGSCALPVGTAGPVCSSVDLSEFTAPCGSGSRCSDGLCRPAGTCPISSSPCKLGEIPCPWALEMRCVTDTSQCEGYNSAQASLRGLEPLSSSHQMNQNDLDRMKHLSTTFPQLSTAAIREIVVASVLMKERLSAASSPMTIAAFQPDPNAIKTCFANCERDLVAKPSTTIITPSSSINNLAISTNQYDLPRSTISIAPGTVSRAAELNIFPAPEALFTSAKVSDLASPPPPTFVEPKKRPKGAKPSASKFASTVISTPFSCTIQRNGTNVEPALAMAVTSFVDTTAYKTSGSAVTQTDTEFPCHYLGSFDSAVANSKCGGSVTITEKTIKVAFPNEPTCGWANGSDLNFSANFQAKLSADSTPSYPNSISWAGQNSQDAICMTITESTRTFSSGSSIVNSVVCAIFTRVTDLLSISFPPNFIVAPGGGSNTLTPQNLEFDGSAPPLETQTIDNALIHDPTGTGQTKQCSTATSDLTQIPKNDICLGFYDYREYSWKCLAPLNEQRLGAPTWQTGMRLNQATASLENCDAAAYAFLNIPLPPPVLVEEPFCFWCKYGWIILVVCIVFVVIVLIVIFFTCKFTRDRVKYKEQQEKLRNMQEYAKDLDENQGGIGVADADGEINMTVNPLVIALADLNRQLEDANLKLDTIGKEEEYHIQRLQQQRQRIQAEIKRVEESLAQDDNTKLAPKRVEAPATTTTTSSAPAGPVRTGGPSGPSAPASNAASGPMRAPPK